MRVAIAALLLLGCDAEGSDAGICEDAASALQECGHAVEAAAFGACEGAQVQDAASLLEAIADEGCAATEEGKGDSLFCRMFPFACEEPAPPLWPEPSRAATKFPILLAHGFNTSTTNFWRFNDVDTLLAEHGHGGGHVALGSVPPFDSPEVRAGFLAEQVAELLEESGAEKVNLLCFSMGGLDCRFLVAPESGMACADGDGDGELDVHCGDVVASVVTLSSPNHGTGIADVAVGVLPDGDRSEAIDFLATLYGKTFSEVADDSHFVATMESMTEARFAGLHDDDPEHVYPKNPKVYYQSWAGWSNVKRIAHPNANAIVEACTVEVGRDEPSPFAGGRKCGADGCSELRMYRHEDTNDAMDALLVGGAAFVAHGLDLLPNDGVSTVRSARFGEFMGCFPADHLDQVGQIDDEGTDAVTGFDYQRLYLRIAEDLATPRLRLFPGPVDPKTGLLSREFKRASF
jgi:triacylglycerol lipase